MKKHKENRKRSFIEWLKVMLQFFSQRLAIREHPDTK